ncbi:tripartite tricarboxylate transporter TctB family protein [Thaumasiovibrio subtropicus]|uniref:tripartite tricarboxylate transporter TctB family protein n=1 Tax=Thaumasiovibrio subtropicus TaxID=1891207 RepID=UPI000B353B29|nr:tripartite tricarboxylate transporter TctB family protein [Thaumasiovibrio subtropicus]
MIITKDHIGGLLFLCFSLLYGYYAGQITLFPGDEFEVFHARSLPNALAIMGAGLAVIQIVTASRKAEDKLSFHGLSFTLMIKLLVLMLLFSAALEWIGFMLSTALFLIGGYWILGEKRVKVLLLASVPFAVVFWFVLTQLLDIYLAPGRIFSVMLGG